MTIEVTYNVTDIYISSEVSPIYIDVNYTSGSSGAAVWGGITGTLSNQTDLQTALNGKFDDPTGTTLQYIDGTGGLQTFPLTLPVLQEVRNQTGATLAAGTVVYISGATGNKPTVTKAIATGDSTSAQTLGMIQSAIANNGTGYVVVIGTCSGLDTSAYSEGQQLYLSYTTAGAVTTTKPYAPNHLVYVGIVTRSHPTLGTIEVRVQNGFEMDELHNVDAYNPTNNDGLFYNTTTSLWEHKSIGTVLGYNPEQPLTFSSPLSRLVNAVSIPAATSSVSGYLSNTDWSTFNGKENALTFSSPLSRSTNTISIPQATSSVSGFLSSTDWSIFNSKQGALTLTTTGTSGAATLVGNTLNIPQYSGAGGMAIGGSITSATAGSVLFAGTSGVLAQNNANFYWDNTNNRLGLGTNTPASQFHVQGASAGIRLLRSGGSEPFILLSDPSELYGGQLRGDATAGGLMLTNKGADTIWFKIFSSGNTTIQTGGTFTDSGFKLDVNGTARIQGNLTTNLTLGSVPFIGTSGVLAQDNTNLFWDNTNKRLGIGTNTPNAALHVSGSTTASGAIARGANYTPTLVAAANNDVLVGLDVNPTFTNGAFTGVTNYGLRIRGNNSQLISIQRSVDGTGGGNFFFTKTRGTVTTPTAIISGDFIGTYIFQGYDGSAFQDSALFGGIVDGSVSSGVVPTAIQFTTGNSASNRSERMRIFSSGNISINTTTDAGFRLDVNGTARVQGQLTITAPSVTSTREQLMRFSVSDAGNNAGFIGNATNADSQYAQMFAGYNDNGTFHPFQLRGLVPSTADTSDSSNFGIIDIFATRTDNATDPNNGTLSSIQNRKVFSIRKGINTFDLLFTIFPNGNINYFDGGNFVYGTTTGTKIGTATNQKIGFWNATPIAQPTTAVSSATRVGGAGNTITDTDTFDGYTISQLVKALRNTGLLA